MSSIAELLGQAESAVRAADDLAALDAVRVQFLGKKGVFTAQLREVGKLPPAEIPAAGKAINDAKAALAAAIDARRDALEARRLAVELAAEALDVTLPGRGRGAGSAASRHADASAAWSRSWATRASTCTRARRSRTTSTTSPR